MWKNHARKNFSGVSRESWSFFRNQEWVASDEIPLPSNREWKYPAESAPTNSSDSGRCCNGGRMCGISAHCRGAIPSRIVVYRMWGGNVRKLSDHKGKKSVLLTPRRNIFVASFLWRSSPFILL